MAGESLRSYYLKVTSSGESSPLKSLHSVIRANANAALAAERSNTAHPDMFGFFQELFGTLAWSVLEFSPHSVDYGISPNDTRYATGKEALDAAILHLGARGYRAVPFNLEGMIDAVR